MDNTTLKKKLSTYLTDKGYLKNVSDELLYEVLIAWENWKGSSKEFYHSIGFSHPQMAGLIGRAKKLKREGRFGSSEFKEIQIETPVPPSSTMTLPPCAGAEVVWHDGRLIRFSGVDLLLDFLKKAA